MPPFPVEDDDLALFNEVQNNEIENFLLQSKIDFDDILPMKSITVSIRGGSSDLLDDEGDKNDYNWLISPPETPLFCSLDDEPPILQSPSKVLLKSKPSSHCSPSPHSRNSPLKASRGNYASPKKIKTRESNSIHGFSSMSPTTFRSVDSVASSVDNDLDSLLSSPISRSVPRKPAKSLSRPAPKRSFDLVRQMDRKGPQHMFRPLMSSVPSSTFHAGDTSSRNYSQLVDSSITTSRSYTGSDLTSETQDPERVIEQNNEEHYSYVEDEVFVMIVNHNLNEDSENTISEPSEQHTVDTVMDKMKMCSKCDQVFRSEEVVTKGVPEYCLECKDSDMNQSISKKESMNVSKSQHLNGVDEHIVENRSYTASSISYDDFSCVSNTTTSMSSSVDLGVSIRKMGQKFSSSKSDTENYRYEMPNTHKGSASSVATSFTERDIEEKTCWISCEQLVASESIEAESTCANIEETLRAQSETLVIEEEDGPLSSLDAISEMVTEDADVISSHSHSDVDSTESKCCMDENEMQQDEEDVMKSVEEFDASITECQVLEESRSLSLEEAMDAILFCSSILHNLAYEAANTAINNETFSMEVLLPTPPFLGKPDSESMDSMGLGTLRKHGSKTQKAQQKMLEMDTESLQCSAETEENTKGSYVVGVPNDADSLKPPKIESKCSCVIM